ncbi:hypothetical protein IE53DRAFT_383647 [Violaceomyces palustris]|uniref:Uncharacterized protein n=1 Tax=Violaceomyces palustris TaxID=1673888 RepID=A0ACD0P6V5_9BASI|nr:hypothetical protein IE53DRAFT_383647 [Violaceomyces palustris]
MINHRAPETHASSSSSSPLTNARQRSSLPSFLLSLPSHNLGLIYDWADRPSNAVKCFARDVKRLQRAPPHISSAIHLYYHFNHPCCYVTVVGLIVGLTEREKKFIYLVDDGTAVVELHYDKFHPIKPEFSLATLRSDRKAKANERLDGHEQPPPTKLTGVPDCYIRPSTPPKSKLSVPESRRAILGPPRPQWSVGQVLSITAKVRQEWGDNVLDNGTVVEMQDPNEEARHMLAAVHLARTVYSQPFIPPPELLSRRRRRARPEIPSLPALEEGRSTSVWGPGSKRHLRGFIESDEEISSTPTRDASSSLHLIKGGRSSSCPPAADEVTPRADWQRRRMDEVKVSALRRMIIGSSDTEGAQPSSTPKLGHRRWDGKMSTADRDLTPTRSRPQKALPFHQPSPKPRRGNESAMHREGSCASSPIPILTSSPASRAGSELQVGVKRHFRHHSKLSDSKVTDSLFRLEIQRHVRKYCSSPSTYSAYRGGSGLGSFPDSKELVPAFTLRYLMRSEPLRNLARRVVRIKLEKRARRRRQEVEGAAAGGSGKALGDHDMGSTKEAGKLGQSKEDVADKVLRLFQWAIRQMLADGFIILASEKARLEPPFDGKKPKRRRPEEHGRRGARRLETTRDKHSNWVLKDYFASPLEGSAGGEELLLPPSSGESSSSADREGFKVVRETRSKPAEVSSSRFSERGDAEVVEEEEEHRKKSRWKGASQLSDPEIDSSSSSDDEEEEEEEEAYQYVVPEIIWPMVERMLQSQGEGAKRVKDDDATRMASVRWRRDLDEDEILKRLKRSDQRFQSVTFETLQDTLLCAEESDLVERTGSGWVLMRRDASIPDAGGLGLG